MKIKNILIIAVLVISTTAIGCSEDNNSTGPATGKFAGEWSGISSLGSQGRSTRLDLEQSGSTVTGTIYMTAILPTRGAAFRGTVNEAGSLDWAASYPEECRTLTGTLNLDSGRMEGPVLLNQQNCVQLGGLSGDMDVERDD